MTVVTLRPNSTIQWSGITTVGADDPDAAISDDSDLTYVSFPSAPADALAYAEFGLTDLTLPTDAEIVGVTVRVRVTSDGPARVFTRLEPSTISGQVSVNTGSGTTLTVFGATVEWTDAEADALSVYVSNIDANVTFRLYELYVDIIYVTKPVVDVIAPTGTITDTLQPTVAWVDTLDSSGGPQTAYEVKIFSAAQYGAGGFDPSTSTPTVRQNPTTSNATTWGSPVDLLSDATTYRAYVRVAQTIHASDDPLLWSDWDYSQFTTDVDTPDAPTVTLTPDHTNARILVSVNDDDSPVVTDYVQVQRQLADTTWEFVRSGQESSYLDASGGDVTLYDYEAPEGVSVSYRARGVHNYSGVYAAGPWGTAATQWNMAADMWVKSPLRPDLNMAVTAYAVGDEDYGVEQGIFDVLGRSDPVVITGARRTLQTEITVEVARSNRADFLELLEQQVLLVQMKVEDDWDDRYVTVGPVKRGRRIQHAWNDVVRFALPLREVVAPTVPAAVVLAPPTSELPGVALYPDDSPALYPATTLYPSD